MRTKNRKDVSYCNSIVHNDATYRINGSQTLGVYLQLIHKAIEQLDACIAKWGRVFVLRFDLRQSEYSDNSNSLSKFRKNLLRKLERRYQISEMGYVWVRERERAKHQHYHCVVYLDGDIIRYSSVLTKIITETWRSVSKGNTVWIPKKRCFYNVKDEATKADAIYHISYLGKSRGKGYRPPQAKDYSTSRLHLRPQA